MVVQEAEMMNNSPQLGEVESQLQSDQQILQEAAAAAAAAANNHNHNQNQHNPFSSSSSLGRQSSIYSLTLDEFQHTLCETGKNFGSMNMDEFLSSIWNAEENQQALTTSVISLNHQELASSSADNKGMTTIRKQPSLPRQGSLSLPAPLCRKTVEEVWSEIHKGHQNQQQHDQIQSNNSNNNRIIGNGSSVLNNNSNNGNTEATPRQPTFGEMTLEDFLVKAGVVREPCAMPAAAVPAASSASSQHHHHHHQQQQQQQYGVYTATNATMAPSSFVARPVIGSGGVAGNVVAPPFPPVAQGSAGERDGSGGGYGVGVCYGGRVVNNGGGGGYGHGHGPPPTMAVMGGPLSPASSDGVGPGEAQFGVEVGVLRGRKRMGDGPVEKVVERRQRRMIKNRESAARSRARKQAYTVELEAELNQLREENTQLKQALAELERRRRQQCFEEMNARVQSKAQKAIEKLRALRRNLSCPL